MWNDLSLAQKSKVMRMAIDNGVRNYDDIKLLYEEASHKFKDGGPKKNNNKSLTEQGVFDMHRSNAQMIIDPLKYNGNPESIVDWDAVNINNTGSMHYDLDNITITAPETKKPEPEVIEKEVPVFIPNDEDYRSNRTKRKLKSYIFEEPKRAKDSLVPITPIFMDTPYSDELQGKVNGEYVYDMPNVLAEGGKTTDDNPDIPMYGSTQQEAVVTGHRMPAWNRFWNKNFRSKSGWDKYVDRYYARQQQMQDTNNTPNPTYEVPDALSIAGIIAGTPYNEDIERAKVWDTYNNWKEHSEIIGPHYDPDGNYHNDAYTNPSAGYLSNADPVGEFFVLNEALGPLAKFIGRGTQQVMARAGNQWARNQIMGRAFNNAADASFGFNNRLVTTPASSVGYEMKPNIRTKIGDVEINNPIFGYKQGSKMSLKFYERPSKLTYAEKAGIPKGQLRLENDPEVFKNAEAFAKKYKYDVPTSIEDVKNMYRRHNRFFRTVELNEYPEGNIFFDNVTNKNVYPELKGLTNKEATMLLASKGYPLYYRTGYKGDLGKGFADDFVFASPNLAENKGYQINGLDKTVMLQRPFSFGSPNKWHLNADYNVSDIPSGTYAKGKVGFGNAAPAHEVKLATDKLIPVKIAEEGDLGSNIGVRYKTNNSADDWIDDLTN